MAEAEKKVKKLNKFQKQSRLFTALITIGLIITILVVMATIKVTPYAVFKSDRYNFQVKYPAFWQRVDNPKGVGIVAFIAPKSYELDVFQENIGITTMPGQGIRAIARITEKIKMQVIGTLENEVIILEDGKAYIAGIPGHRFAYTTSDENIENPIHYSHVWFVKNDVIYIITYAAQKDEYEDNLKYFNKVVRTFKFISPR